MMFSTTPPLNGKHKELLTKLRELEHSALHGRKSAEELKVMQRKYDRLRRELKKVARG